METLNELKCPKCGDSMTLEDVNVATDIALCRSCNQISKFSEMVTEKQYEGILDSMPTRMSVTRTARGIELTYKKSRIMGFAIFGFALLWSTFVCFCVNSMLSKEGGPDWDGVRFLIPFILIGVGIFSVALYVFFGRMVLTLNFGSGELFRGIGSIGRRQRFRLEKDAQISIHETNIYVNSRLLYKIAVDQPRGKPFEFGTCLAEEDARRYVVALLRRMRG